MIECVEDFRTKFNRLLLVQNHTLEQSEIGVRQGRTAAECARRIAEGVVRVLREGAGVEPFGDLLPSWRVLG